jgi:hypothetical protein
MVQDLLLIDLPASRKLFPVQYHLYFKVFEKRSLIYTYHILKRLILAGKMGGQFRRSITQITIEFDHVSYQEQLNSQSDMEQVANFTEFLNTKLSRVTEVRLVIDDIVTVKNGDQLLAVLIPQSCTHVTLRRVKCKDP